MDVNVNVEMAQGQQLNSPVARSKQGLDVVLALRHNASYSLVHVANLEHHLRFCLQTNAKDLEVPWGH